MTTIDSIRDRNTDPQQSQLAAEAFETLPEPLAVLDGACIAESNEAFRRMLGLDHAQIAGRTLSELGIEDNCVRSFSGFVAHGRDLRVISLQNAKPSADQFRSQKLEAVGRLVSGVAHDFNNLLTGVVLCCDLMLAKLDSADPVRRYAHEMKAAAAQGTSLVQQLLTVLREEPVMSGPLSWNFVVNDMRDLLARLIGENIELATELTDGLQPVPIDAAEARQIVLNLVLNARDAMPDGGRIVLATRDRVAGGVPDAAQSSINWVEFEVSDTGCGMDEEVRQTIFQPFFTTKASGYGLGLATVKSIVDRQGGRIDVASQPGKGTQITIGFPAAQTQAA
jgi:two-component system, cell cycle sensor histidine kinase and response regulator CckA